MWDSFVAWGQAYGLYTTIILLFFIILMMRAENKKLRLDVEELRLENSKLKKLDVLGSSEVKTDV